KHAELARLASVHQEVEDDLFELNPVRKDPERLAGNVEEAANAMRRQRIPLRLYRVAQYLGHVHVLHSRGAVVPGEVQQLAYDGRSLLSLQLDSFHGRTFVLL